MLVLGLVEVPWWGILLTSLPTAIVVFYIYETWDFDYFKKQGVPGPEPRLILGTVYRNFGKALPYVELEAMETYGHKGYYGKFLGSKPMLVVYDQDMLNEITIKQFQYFTNRNNSPTNSINDKMVFNLHGAHWKHVRSEMSPAFTTGKLKRMNSEINRCGKALADSLLEAAKTSKTVEIREYAGGYTMDVIASTAFGIRVESQKDRNNAYVQHAGRAVGAPNANIRLLILFFFPRLSQFLMKLGYAVNIFKEDVVDFFTNIAKQTIEMRKEQEDKTRTDFLQLMIKAQRGESVNDDVDGGDETNSEGGKPQGIPTDEILANAMLFFIAGYDTTATTLSFLMYNLACHPDVQDKLVKEINNVIGDADTVDYSLLQDMVYLDQCVNETLRLYTPVVQLDRVATRDITINGVFIRKGVAIGLPYFTIHRDPKRWPDPEKFDPDRFSAENKKKHHPMDFVPFGAGPRICLAQRLALQEIKVAAIHVLRKVKICTCEKTQIPIVFANAGHLLRAEGGLHLKPELRTTQ